MLRRLLWLWFCFALLGCGRDARPKQFDEPCTRTAQCAVGLVCLAGVCVFPADAGPDGGPDSGADAGS